jgi:hypothetical protein
MSIEIPKTVSRAELIEAYLIDAKRRADVALRNLVEVAATAGIYLEEQGAIPEPESGLPDDLKSLYKEWDSVPSTEILSNLL